MTDNIIPFDHELRQERLFKRWCKARRSGDRREAARIWRAYLRTFVPKELGDLSDQLNAAAEHLEES